MQFNEIQSRGINGYLAGEKVSLLTFQTGKIGMNAKEIFRCISKLNLKSRLVNYKVLRLRDLNINTPVTYEQIRKKLYKYRLFPVSLELALFLASTHWEWRKPKDADVKFFMNPVATLHGYMGYMISAPGYMLDGYEIDQSWFYPDDVFVFVYIKNLQLN